MAKKADSRPANLDELIIKELDLAYNNDSVKFEVVQPWLSR